jgi:hypothetical protein
MDGPLGPADRGRADLRMARMVPLTVDGPITRVRW